MAEGFVRTVHKGGQWVNEIEGGAEFGGTHSTKEQAVAAGRARAMQDGTDDHDADTNTASPWPMRASPYV